MAHLYFARTVSKSGGRRAAARLAYLTGRTVTDPDQEARQRPRRRAGREDLVAVQTRNLPDWAHGSPHTYFRAAERYEGGGDKRRYNAFEEWKIALPQELTRAQNQALIEDLIDCIAGDRLPCTYAFHAPLTTDGTQPQPHLHLLLSARQTDDLARSPAQHFQRYNSKEPGKGGAQKDRALAHRGAVKAYRLMIADILNVHLERHGLEERVHPETLVSRGIARPPEPKLLPSESAAYRKRGVVGTAMAAVLKVRGTRAQTRTQEQMQAREAWKDRKMFLGLSARMAPADQLAMILLKRHGSVERVPARYRDRAAALVRRRPRQRETPALVAQLAGLAARLEGEEQAGRGVRVRLWDRETGMGF